MSKRKVKLGVLARLAGSRPGGLGIGRDLFVKVRAPESVPAPNCVRFYRA